ncbi:hypothetical protein [Photobacterium angustum]|uniref:hypothetical protein n=1 Tax=Photobacterium angustum TaxID=661 RepID=UPI0005E299A3|nr:hypothetical protein [Photobacterium angustum]KJF93836.1 hypothetical protein UB39_14020 [Photobacterium angustum]PSW82259.1 hypothetical protein CTN03_03565 [Photobacterium angustum]
MKNIAIVILVSFTFVVGFLGGMYFGIEPETSIGKELLTKSSYDLLIFASTIVAALGTAAATLFAVGLYLSWKAQHKKELLIGLKTEAIDRLLKSHTALTNFTYHNACKDTSIAFSNAITDLQSINMRYFSSISSSNLSTMELMAFNISNVQMQFVKDYASFMSHFYNGVQRKCIFIDKRALTFIETSEGIVRKGILSSYLEKLGVKLEIIENQLDVQKLATELYLAIIDNSGELVTEAYSREDRI